MARHNGVWGRRCCWRRPRTRLGLGRDSEQARLICAIGTNGQQGHSLPHHPPCLPHSVGAEWELCPGSSPAIARQNNAWHSTDRTSSRKLGAHTACSPPNNHPPKTACEPPRRPNPTHGNIDFALAYHSGIISGPSSGGLGSTVLPDPGCRPLLPRPRYVMCAVPAPAGARISPLSEHDGAAHTPCMIYTVPFGKVRAPRPITPRCALPPFSGRIIEAKICPAGELSTDLPKIATEKEHGTPGPLCGP